MRGVSLDEIAAATRINTRFLEALENGRWDQLPGGAFNRGFIRATSRFLGLDEDSMVAEYALETDGASPSRASHEGSGAMPRDLRPAVAAIAVVVLLLVGIVWFTYHEISVYRHRRAAAAASVVHPATHPAAAPVPAGSASIVTPTDNGSSAVAGGASASQPPPAPIASVTLALRIEAAKAASLRIVADGKSVFRRRLHADEVKTFEARDSFEVSSNDPAALHLELNGQPVEFAGAPGRRGASLTLTRKDLKSPAPPR
jgi:cytoskeleton protein RodZ